MKTSLHILGILLLALFISATSGCGGGETKPDTGGTTVTPPPPPTPEEQLVGKYTLTNVVLKENDQEIVLEPPQASGTLVLEDNADRSWSMFVDLLGTQRGNSGDSWKATATQLTLGDGVPISYQLNGSILKFDMEGIGSLSWKKL